MRLRPRVKELLPKIAEKATLKRPLLASHKRGYAGLKLDEVNFGVLPTVVSPELFGVFFPRYLAYRAQIALGGLDKAAKLFEQAYYLAYRAQIALGGLDKAAKLFEQAYPSVKSKCTSTRQQCRRRSGRVPETADCN